MEDEARKGPHEVPIEDAETRDGKELLWPGGFVAEVMLAVGDAATEEGAPPVVAFSLAFFAEDVGEDLVEADPVFRVGLTGEQAGDLVVTLMTMVPLAANYGQPGEAEIAGFARVLHSHRQRMEAAQEAATPPPVPSGVRYKSEELRAAALAKLEVIKAQADADDEQARKA